MNRELIKIIEESVKLELNTGALYHQFYELFLEDAEFWWELQMEENNHASLLKSLIDFFIPYDKYPMGLLVENLNELKATNSFLEKQIKMVMDKPLTRNEAFELALNVEESAAELHYQDFMSGAEGNKFENVLRTLNREDKDHYKRIKEYMEENL